MAFDYLTAVQETLSDTITTAPSNRYSTNIDDLNVGAIRRIWATNTQHLAKPHGQMFVNNGKFVIATLGDHDQPNATPASWITNCRNWANAMAVDSGGPSTMVELINEPYEKYWSATGSDYPKYWNRIRDVAPIIRAAGMEVVLGLPPTGGDRRFLNQAAAEGDIFDLIDGVGVHPYVKDPGTMVTRTGNTTVGSDVITNMSSTAGLSVGQKVQGRGIPNLLGGTNPATGITAIGPGLQITISDNASQTHAGTTFGFGSAGSQVMWMMARRAQVENFGGGAENLWFWITEFGWGTQRHLNQGPENLYTGPPQGAPRPPVNAAEVKQEDNLTQAYTNWETHAGALKLRAATWFWLRDFSNSRSPTNPDVGNPNNHGTFQYCGLRTDESDPALGGFNPPPWRWKNVTVGDNPQNPTTGIKAALDSFGWGATIGNGGGGAAPDAITLTPPNPLAQTSATLRGTVDPNDLSTQWYFQYSRNPLPAIDPLAEPVGFLPRTNNDAASRVIAHPAEERPQNVENANVPVSGDLTDWRAAFTSTALSHYKANVNGNYGGHTTDEIIQWAARKWGFHPDILRAVAVKESDWDQGQLGDARVTTALAAACTMPGDTTITVVDRDAIAAEPVEPIVQVGTGADYMRWGGTATGPERLTGCTPHARFYPGSGTVASGQQVKGVWDSYGLFQMKRPYAWTTPHVHIPRDNSAFCADYYGQILRGYYNGLETWLSAYDPPAGPNTQAYEAGDLWGSIGAWYSGRWWDSAAQGYIASVDAIYRARTWEGF